MHAHSALCIAILIMIMNDTVSVVNDSVCIRMCDGRQRGESLAIATQLFVAICPPIAENGAGCVYAIDRDHTALQFAHEIAAHLPAGSHSQSLIPLHGPFSAAGQLLAPHGVQ